MKSENKIKYFFVLNCSSLFYISSLFSVIVSTSYIFYTYYVANKKNQYYLTFLFCCFLWIFILTETIFRWLNHSCLLCYRRSTLVEMEAKEKKMSHQCEYCRKLFSWPSDLKMHVRIHTHEKPFRWGNSIVLISSVAHCAAGVGTGTFWLEPIGQWHTVPRWSYATLK